ncbi:MAG: hypothetical protein HYY20_07590, partial [Candidatus Tectomicrobia bacterium]|nr:hypothetical protein [Candidatus Tectomicrobia bacterium]
MKGHFRVVRGPRQGVGRLPGAPPMGVCGVSPRAGLVRALEKERAEVYTREISSLLQTLVDEEEATGVGGPEDKIEELPAAGEVAAEPRGNPKAGEEGLLDPLRAYFREMGSRPLLTHEGEIALGK